MFFWKHVPIRPALEATSRNARRGFQRRARLWLTVVFAAPLFAVAIGASVSQTAGATQGNQAFTHELEMDLAGNGAATTTGEPEIAVNPLNPRNLFIDWTTFNYPPSATAPIPDPCGGLSSQDGGLSWQPAPVPLTGCADAVSAFGPDGTLYAGGIVTTSVTPVACSTPGAIMYVNGCILVEGYDAVLRSSDGGHSWSAPVKTMGSANNGPFPFAPGSGNPLLTLDRPWIAVDQSTNTVYAAGHNIADHEGFVTASTNDGQSFGTIYAIDSPTYPSGGLFGGNIAAAHGVLAVAYTAASAPGATCPCVIFETSTNHGATFTAHVVPTVDAAAQPVPFVAADPNAKGHFAVTIFDSTGTENQVYTTNDNGATWSGPALVGESFPDQQFKPWLSYGPGGELLLVWRTWLGTPNTAPYDVWAAVGHNQGRRGPVFSAPMQVSSVAGAYPPQYGAGDDFSWVIADQKFVDIGWGDARDLAVGAGVQTWFARIPLATLEGTHA